MGCGCSFNLCVSDSLRIEIWESDLWMPDATVLLRSGDLVQWFLKSRMLLLTLLGAAHRQGSYVVVKHQRQLRFDV